MASLQQERYQRRHVPRVDRRDVPKLLPHPTLLEIPRNSPLASPEHANPRNRLVSDGDRSIIARKAYERSLVRPTENSHGPGGGHCLAFRQAPACGASLTAFDLGLISATALQKKDLTPRAVERGYVVGYCNLWQEDQGPADAIAEAVAACSAPRHVLAKVRDKLKTHVAARTGGFY